MPKLPVVRSRQSRVSGQPSQVAGALIPDNTQHPWRDDVWGKFQLSGFKRNPEKALNGGQTEINDAINSIALKCYIYKTLIIRANNSRCGQMRRLDILMTYTSLKSK